MIGIGNVFGFSLETTWGTPAGTVDNYAWTFAGMEGIEATVVEIRGEDLQDRTSRDDQVDPGTRQAAGPVAMDLQYGGGWIMFPSILTGEDPVTTGAGPYVHTLHLGAALAGGGGGNSNLGEGITCFVDRAGTTASAGAKAWAYKGGKPKAIEFVFAMDGRCRMSADMWFQDFASFGSRLTASLPARSWMVSPSAAASPSDFFTYNATAYRAIAATIKLEQDWEGLMDLQDPTANAHAIASGMKVSGSVTIEAPESAAGSGGAFWDDYRSKTTRAMVFTAEGPTAASESLVITLHSALVTNAQDPKVAGPGTLRHTVEFEGLFDSGNSEIGTLVLTSSDTAAWS